MRLQLRLWLAGLMALALVFRSAAAWAQSTVKFKRLKYDETAPGVDVDEDLLEVLVQLDNEDQLSASVLHDVVTGASPTGIPENASVTGASATAAGGQQTAAFRDERWSYTAGYLPLIGRTTRLKGLLHYSEERDYIARGATLGAAFELNKKNTTIAPAFTCFDDSVLPQNGKPGRSKLTRSAALDIAQVLNTWNVAGLGLSYNRGEGYLTDPYKQVLVGGEALEERRPDHREGYAVQAGLRTKPFERHAFDLSYRYYWDDWGVRSHTYGVKSLSELGEQWLIELFYRYYIQSGADFWASSFAAGDDPRYRSSDLRLAPFQAMTLGITGIYKLSDAWWVEASVAQYRQDPTYGYGGDGEDEHEDEHDDDDDLRHEIEGEGEGGGSLIGTGSNVSAWIYSIAIQFRF
jgi:opacity protein-like surface antigen